jgi:hypothetical protein
VALVNQPPGFVGNTCLKCQIFSVPQFLKKTPYSFIVTLPDLFTKQIEIENKETSSGLVGGVKASLIMSIQFKSSWGICNCIKKALNPRGKSVDISGTVRR